jgi:hypothetical protein
MLILLFNKFPLLQNKMRYSMQELTNRKQDGGPQQKSRNELIRI